MRSSSNARNATPSRSFSSKMKCLVTSARESRRETLRSSERLYSVPFASEGSPPLFPASTNRRGPAAPSAGPPAPAKIEGACGRRSHIMLYYSRLMYVMRVIILDHYIILYACSMVVSSLLSSLVLS